MIELSNSKRFASGGNRNCYRHPEHNDRCLKVLKPGRSPAERREQKGFPANVRSLEIYDENLVELNILTYLHNYYPEAIRRHLPISYGMVETDLGLAHETSLILDQDGLISQTLEQYLWSRGLDDSASESIQSFKTDWAHKPPKTRDLIPHNFVVQDLGSEQRLILIDGIGRRPLLRIFDNPLSRWSLFNRRMRDFDSRIRRILELVSSNAEPPGRLTNLTR